MSIKSILLLGNSVLRQNSEDVSFPLSAEDQQLLTDLNDTIKDFKIKNGFGRGIAAPQIGVLKRVVCVNIDGPQYYINPKIVEYSAEKYRLFDDCFSMPEIMVNIERSKKITVEFYDQNGEIHVENFEEGMSELLQHEIDHLNGIMAIDRITSTKDIWSRKQWHFKQKQ